MYIAYHMRSITVIIKEDMWEARDYYHITANVSRLLKSCAFLLLENTTSNGNQTSLDEEAALSISNSTLIQIDMTI